MCYHSVVTVFVSKPRRTTVSTFSVLENGIRTRCSQTFRTESQRPLMFVSADSNVTKINTSLMISPWVLHRYFSLASPSLSLSLPHPLSSFCLSATLSFSLPLSLSLYLSVSFPLSLFLSLSPSSSHPFSKGSCLKLTQQSLHHAFKSLWSRVINHVITPAKEFIDIPGNRIIRS